MSINESNLVNQIKSNHTNYKSTHTHPTISKELSDFLSVDVHGHLNNSKLKKSCFWMLEQNRWINNEANAFSNFRNYGRGDIIMSLDLGASNIGSEIRHPHPCVVLYDNNEDWVIVAPITEASRDTAGVIVKYPFEVLAQKTKTSSDVNEYIFQKDSVIQVDQIKRVSKYRSVNDNSKKIRTDLLNEIDNLVLENYVPKKYKLLESLKGLIIDERKNNAELLLQIEHKDNEISHLKRKNAQTALIIETMLEKCKSIESYKGEHNLKDLLMSLDTIINE